MLRLIPLAILILTLTACGGSRKKVATPVITDPEMMTETAEGDGDQTEGPEAADAAEAGQATAGDGQPAIPNVVKLVIIPGNGYLMNGKKATLNEIDELLRLVAKNNRYADIQLRTHNNGTATLIQPVLDLTVKHKLVNVTLNDGQ